MRFKIGRSPPNTDFSAFSCDFQNLSLCSAAAGNTVTNTWFNWPIGQWSARLRVDGSHGYVQAGAYVINPRDLEPTFTLSHASGETGVLYPVELGWTPTLAGRSGSYKIGVWRSTADTPNPQRGPAANAVGPADPFTPPRSSRSGAWVNVEQQLTGGPGSARAGSGLSVFFNFTQADRRTARIDQQIAAGLFDGGLLPGRPQDVVGLGLARTHLNNSAGAGLGSPSGPPQAEGAEYLAEAYYSYRPRPWLSLRPNIQVIHHPGGQKTRSAVVVFGLKAGLKL